MNKPKLKEQLDKAIVMLSKAMSQVGQVRDQIHIEIEKDKEKTTPNKR